MRLRDGATEEDLPRLGYSVEEAAKATGLGRSSIYAAMKSGQLVGVKINKRTIILAPSLHTFLLSAPRVA